MENQTNTLGRTVESVLARATDSLGNFDVFLTAIYDAVKLIDGAVTTKNAHKHAPLLVATAQKIAELADTLKSHSYNELRWTLTNLSINYLMVVVEALERKNKQAEAKALVEGLVYELSTRITKWDEEFAPERRILGRLGWQEHSAPKLTCNREAAVERIHTFHEARAILVRKIERNIAHSEYLRREMQSLIDSGQRMFEMDMGGDILRLRAETPYSFKTMKRWVLAAERYAASIDTKDLSEANINKSARVINVHHLAEAMVKSLLAYCYVEYWKSGPGYRNFEVLGHNALGYAEAVYEDNWDFFAPLATCKAHEKLDEESARDLRLLNKYADAALGYAMCLDVQMRVLPQRQQPPQFKHVRVAKPEQPEELKPAEIPSIGAFCESLKTQAEAREFHIGTTGDNKREDAWLGIGRSRGPRIYPKQRLIGFDRLRGGSSHKGKKRRTKPAAV